MRIKKEPLVLAVVIIGLLFYILYRDSDRSFYEIPKLEKETASEITKIDVVRSGKTVSLERESDGGWRIMPQEYPAESRYIDRMANTLADLTLTAMVSESEAYARYGLDDAKKVTVKAWCGDRLARQLDIGKAASGMTFVRIPGDKRVFQAGESFRWHFDMEMEGMRDLTVLVLKPKEIVEIEIQKDQEVVKIVRNTGSTDADSDRSGEPTWIGPLGKTVVESSVDYLLKNLSNLKCERYVQGKTKEDFTDFNYSIKLKGPEALFIKLTGLVEGKEGKEEEYIGVSSQNRYPFYLNKYEAMKILTSPDELIKAESPDTGKTEESKPE